MELICSALLVMFICMVLVTNNTEVYKPNITHAGLMIGFVVFLLIEGYGPYSGANMNTAVTLSLVLMQQISIARAVIYVIVQLIGSIVGSGLAYSFTSANTLANATTSFHSFNPESSGLTCLQGVGVEAVITFNLIFVLLSCIDTKNRTPAVLPALPIALCITCGVMAAGTNTGAAVNPIVPFSVAVLTGDFKNNWVYWVGPLSGSLLATGLYKVLILIKDKFEPRTDSTTDELRYAVSREEVAELVDGLLQNKQPTNDIKNPNDC